MNPALVNHDAESTVLGSVLLDSEALYRALPLLQAQDFSLDSHRRIYHIIAELAEAGKPVDDLTLTDALIAKGQLESVGGVAYISSLSDNVTSELARTEHIEHHAQTLRDKSRRRQTLAAATVLAAATEDATVSTDECLQLIQKSLLQIEADSAKSTARHAKEFMPDVLCELETQAQNQGLIGMPTGIHSLDLVTGGIRCGELWTIGALPGKGKTALGVQVALANGSAGIPTYAFSLEMQDLEIGKRFLAAKSSVAAGQIRNPQTIREDRWSDLRRAAAHISECPIYVDVRGSIKIQELLASARLYIRRHGVKLIVVDYLRLVDAPGRATGQD